jgi:hypothetical protein
MKFTVEHAREFYKESTGTFKGFLEKNFPELITIKIPDLTKTKWAFEKLGKDFFKFISRYKSNLEMLQAEFENGNLTTGELAEEVLTLQRNTVLKGLETVIEAKNKGWKPNWDDYNEKKWRGWFVLGSPCRFDGADDLGTGADAGCASRLHLRNEADAIEVANEYLDLWEFYMTK